MPTPPFDKLFKELEALDTARENFVQAQNNLIVALKNFDNFDIAYETTHAEKVAVNRMDRLIAEIGKQAYFKYLKNETNKN